MKTHILGLPRIGRNRELKKSLENYWSGKEDLESLNSTSKKIRLENITIQRENSLDLITVGDFSLYDQVLDTSIMLSNIPSRFKTGDFSETDRYFNIARGVTIDNEQVVASDMRKFFNTNYHYIVPEFSNDTKIELNASKIINEIEEAIDYGIEPKNIKPVVIGPITYLWLSKENSINKLTFYNNIKEAYLELFSKINSYGVKWIQIDEPILVLNRLNKEYSDLFTDFYKGERKLKIILATYFDSITENIETIKSLDVDTLHVDITKNYNSDYFNPNLFSSLDVELSIGCIDGRNIWKTDYEKLSGYLKDLKSQLGDSFWLSTSSSLQYLPVSTKSEELPNWLSFAHERIGELRDVNKLLNDQLPLEILEDNKAALKELCKIRSNGIQASSLDGEIKRKSEYNVRKEIQDKILNLPAFPTTTIGSFPQTKDLRSTRFKWKNSKISDSEYTQYINLQIRECIEFQEDIGLDVLVHGEFERTDMVEYFAEYLEGYITTRKGWVQSYGSRCVKPGIIYSNIVRPEAITTSWINYAQSLTDKIVKGMLTGPVTMLKWSFVRNDVPYEETLNQMSLAINQEVLDLEKEGVKVIQIDEAALREGLPLKDLDIIKYKKSASRAFRLSSYGVKDHTQIHTHMCYSNFDDILDVISDMDADVITIETTRSEMSLLDNLYENANINSIGPGVYDIHSPNIPDEEDILNLINKARSRVPEERLWINPDCGLKTRKWDEVKKSLKNMVKVAASIR